MMGKSPCDMLLRNGWVIDGTGKPAFRADVAIRGDRIDQVEVQRAASARAEIDLRGLVVAPGFIDVHAHDDLALITQPAMTPKLTQGVTTVISGNCGIGGAPYPTSIQRSGLLRLIFKSDPFLAPTLNTYLQTVMNAKPAINSAFLTGHTTLRTTVMGADLDRPATDIEIQEMRHLLIESLREGSLGLSTGLFYPEARASSTREIIEVAKPLNSYQGVYVTHMRDEADGVMESLQETLQIGREVGVRVIVSHHKCLGRRNFGRSVETLKLLEDARRDQPVALDVYPYTAGSTVLNEELAIQSERTVITWSDPYPEFAGRELSDAAQKLGCSPREAIARLLPAGALYFMMDEMDMTRILCSPEAMIGSDGLPGDQHPHPRLWGTFTRVLGRYVRERRLLSVEDAVHRMTGLPARLFGLCNRGEIAVGKYADLCIFDPASILDTATYDNPISPSAGVHYVFVNGELALMRGVSNPSRAGRVLRRRDLADSNP
jgi:N-acyl-D-amino-acid deacylase